MKIEEIFDAKHPEFKTAVGIEFAKLSADTQTRLLAEWAKADQWDKVFDGQAFISPFMSVEALNGNSFHTWLLTNPNAKAFELWQNIRDRQKNDQTYRAEPWGDSAALVLYSNRIERLSALGLADWSRGIDVQELMKGGIAFSSHADASDKTRDSVNQAWFKGDKTRIDAPMDCAFFHGSEAAIDACLTAYSKAVAGSPQQHTLPKTWAKHSLFKAAKWYMRFGDELPLEPLVNALQKTKTWSVTEDRRAYGMDSTGENNLLKTAFLRFGLQRISEFWKNAPQEPKDDLSMDTWQWVNFKRKLLKASKLSQLTLIQVLENAHFSQKQKSQKDFPDFSLSDLWESAKEGNTLAVRYLLDRNPEWLEEKDWVYENRSGSRYKASAGSKKGTVLALAAVHGHQTTVDFLLERGAASTSLKDLMEYEPFKNSEHYEAFKPIAERIRLRQKVTKKSDVELKKAPQSFAL